MTWILLALAVLTEHGFAEPARLGATGVVDLRPHLESFHDPDGRRTFDQVRAERFTPGFDGGFFRGATWLRARICVDDARPWQLVYKDPIQALDVFTPDGRGGYVEARAGLDRRQTDFWIRVPLWLGGCGDVYARLASADVVNGNLVVMDDASYLTLELRSVALYAFFYAVMLVVLAAVLTLFRRTARPAFLLLTGLILLQDGFGTALVNGFLFRYVFESSTFSRFDLGNLFVLLYDASILIFALSFGEVRHRGVRWFTYLLIGAQMAALTPLLVNLVWPVHSPSATWSWAVNRAFMFSGVWMFVIAVLGARTRNGVIFAGMTTVKVTGILIKAFALEGKLPVLANAPVYDFLVYNALAFASLAEAVGVISLLILSYADEVRAKAISLDRARADARLVDVCRQVAHDIRSPLGALKIGVELARVGPDHRALLGAATKRIEEIADGLLRLRAEITPGPVALAEVVGEIVREKLVQRPGLDVRTAVIDRPVVWISSAEVKRALSNVIENAAEAVGRGGSVRVTIDVVGPWARVVVTDDGVGMDDRTLAQVGTKGFSTKPFADSGAGLGVHHARATAAAAGGTLMFTSAPGRGTEVVIRLPVHDGP